MRVEDGGEEQHQKNRIDDVGKGVVESVIEHQNDEAQHSDVPIHTICMPERVPRLKMSVSP
jgi:hypothetical protein